MCEKCERKKRQKDGQFNNFVNGALMGTLMGVALGVLMAPESGAENRKKLKKASEDAFETGKDIWDAIDEISGPIIEQSKPVVKTAVDKSVPVAKEFASTIAQLADPELEHIHVRAKKANKNASERNFFKGSF